MFSPLDQGLRKKRSLSLLRFRDDRRTQGKAGRNTAGPLRGGGTIPGLDVDIDDSQAFHVSTQTGLFSFMGFESWRKALERSSETQTSRNHSKRVTLASYKSRTEAPQHLPEIRSLRCKRTSLALFGNVEK